MIFTILFAMVFFAAFFFLIIMPIVSWIYERRILPRRMARIPKEPDFPVDIVVPCHGKTEHLEANLRAIASQDYPDYRVTFVTDTADDTAVAAISAVLKDNPKASHLVAGYSDKTYGKNYAQIVAIAADRTSEVFVISDSDLRPRRDYLRTMVKPFVDPRVKVTSSSRWIMPSGKGIAQYMYTALEGFRPMMLASPFFVLLWGGSFAISRKAYDEMGIENAWSNTEDDDLVLCDSLIKRRSRPVFVPGAVSYSHEVHQSVAKMAKWFTYQAFTGRIHSFFPWLVLLLVETFLSVGMVGAVSLAAVQAATRSLDYGALGAPVLLALIALNSLLVKLPYRELKDMPIRWWMLIAIPGHFVMAFAVWRSAFQQKMYRGHVTLEFNRDGTIRRYIRHGEREAAKNPEASPGTTSSE